MISVHEPCSLSLVLLFKQENHPTSVSNLRQLLSSGYPPPPLPSSFHARPPPANTLTTLPPPYIPAFSRFRPISSVFSLPLLPLAYIPNLSSISLSISAYHGRTPSTPRNLQALRPTPLYSDPRPHRELGGDVPALERSSRSISSYSTGNHENDKPRRPSASLNTSWSAPADKPHRFKCYG